MFFRFFKNTSFLFLFSMLFGINTFFAQSTTDIKIAANQTEKYLPLLQDKKVGVVANQTSIIYKENKKYIHLVDSLLNRDIAIQKVFSPEHGFRGNADAGEHVKNALDKKTGLPIISLYGKNKKPNAEQLADIDIILFDIQDVGVRFYTYISTLHYVMEAAAEANIPVIVLDRPNPNAHYIDGPILEEAHKSFVGMHPVPIVYGMTIGEYACMINEEKWLKNNVSCQLTIIPLENYTHQTSYELPIKPSPNLPNAKAINLYPSLCFFEGTNVNAGRGTTKQFQVFGSPWLAKNHFDYQYTPQPNFGAKNPKNKGKLCYGRNLENTSYLNHIELKWLIEAYQNTKNKNLFFTNFFEKLAGTSALRKQIETHTTASEIRKSWQKGIDNFKKTRSKYLIYK
ncbi:exo-beta-N-acetylmuramidase NamZ family protein [Mesonia hippocampi]|uniref:exo-beta-N-acetylmuramidase NamZ family protein n=2 Tax=Mesonia hippocampi TaxID=1628250 RepID=UPI003F9B0571